MCFSKYLAFGYNFAKYRNSFFKWGKLKELGTYSDEIVTLKCNLLVRKVDPGM
jgi:hypothetical protein